MKVLIVGAGPTGLTAALECARQGIIPEIIDAKDAPSELSRAVGILPESITHLTPSGAGERIMKEGMPLSKVLMNYRGRSFTFDTQGIFAPQELPIALPQDQTERILSEVLAEKGVVVRYSTTLRAIQSTDTSVQVTLSDGENKTYDWVIGADGINSTVRENLGIPFQGYELPETWSIADVDVNGYPGKDPTFDTEVRERNGEVDLVVAIPIGEKRLRIVSSTPDSLATFSSPFDIQNVRRSGSFKIAIKQAESYVYKRVLLAGDSAHVHSPVGGRGMNLGIEDAVKAVEAILHNTTEAYNHERHKAGARVINYTERARTTLASNNLLVRTFLPIIFTLLEHSRFLKSTLLKKIFQL